MKTVIFLSDTHGFLDENLNPYFEECDEIWHAGDIGDISMLKKLSDKKPLKAVWGNIDDHKTRYEIPEFIIFECEGLTFLMIHIIGTLTNYSRQLNQLLKENQPKVVLYGHSHQVVVKKDKNGLVLINPGAAGKQGFHLVRTAFKLTIDNKKITNFELINLGKR